MQPMVEMCCGQRPIEQVRHGRRKRFCLRCGETSDAGPVTIEQRMTDELKELRRGDKRTPALMMQCHDEVRGIKKR